MWEDASERLLSQAEGQATGSPYSSRPSINHSIGRGRRSRSCTSNNSLCWGTKPIYLRQISCTVIFYCSLLGVFCFLFYAIFSVTFSATPNSDLPVVDLGYALYQASLAPVRPFSVYQYCSPTSCTAKLSILQLLQYKICCSTTRTPQICSSSCSTGQPYSWRTGWLVRKDMSHCDRCMGECHRG